MTRGSSFLVAGAWVTVPGLIGMVIVSIGVRFVTGSLPTVCTAMYAGFVVIIVELVLNAIGHVLRSGPIGDLSAWIIALNPSVTLVGAPHLIACQESRRDVQHDGSV